MKVLEFENMLSYAPIRVKIESTGQILAFEAGTSMPSCAIIYGRHNELRVSKKCLILTTPVAVMRINVDFPLSTKDTF